MRNLRVAMIAPPWLPIPPDGYGGIENVLADLVPALLKLDVEVELFTIHESKTKATRKHWLYKDGQYEHIHKPGYDSIPIVSAHILYSLNKILEDGQFDIIHNHNQYMGPAMVAYAGRDMPPVLHTLHGPPFTTPDRIAYNIPDNSLMWHQLSKSNQSFYTAISRSSMNGMPSSLKKHILKPVYNGINLEQFPFVANKDDYFITLARFHPDKGQKLAVEAAIAGGHHLKMAGLVGDMTRPKQVMLELANPASRYRSLLDFRYFSDYIFPYLEDGQIEYVGDIAGDRKMKLIGSAKALLFPIQWEEPFGMAPIEALACGTPVVAMARGALPEIIKHGSNGFLAKNKREFVQYMRRVGDIDPAACRKSVERKFSAKIMARNYLDRYEEVIRAAY